MGRFREIVFEIYHLIYHSHQVTIVLHVVQFGVQVHLQSEAVRSLYILYPRIFCAGIASAHRAGKAMQEYRMVRQQEARY